MIFIIEEPTPTCCLKQKFDGDEIVQFSLNLQNKIGWLIHYHFVKATEAFERFIC